MRAGRHVTTVSTMSDDTTPPSDEGSGTTPPPPPPYGSEVPPTPPTPPTPPPGGPDAGGAMPPPPPPPPPAYGDAGGMPPPPVAPAGPRPGTLLDRFLARLIDGILVAIVQGILVSVIVVGAIMDSSGGFYGGTSYAASAVSGILSALLYVGYFAYMESSRGQTVGKMVMKLHTEGPAGGNPTMEQAIRRNIWGGASVLGIVPVVGPAIGGLIELVAVIMIAVGINSDTVARQGWHDKFAGDTRVIKRG
jgi:uncharacterized RDD family membrane protein YckC